MTHPERRRPPDPRRGTSWRVTPSITPAPEWTVDDLPPDDPGKWVRCRRCPHLRLEHSRAGTRCDVLHDADAPHTRCDCAGFEPITPRRETS